MFDAWFTLAINCFIEETSVKIHKNHHNFGNFWAKMSCSESECPSLYNQMSAENWLKNSGFGFRV